MNARHLASQDPEKLGFKILTVTTYVCALSPSSSWLFDSIYLKGTPHKGVEALGLLFNSGTAPIVKTGHAGTSMVDTLGLLVETKFRLVLRKTLGHLIGSDLGALKSMTVDETKKLANKTKKSEYAKKVKYFTWAGRIRLSQPLLVSSQNLGMSLSLES